MTLDSSGFLAGTWSENEKEDALIELSHSNLIAVPTEQIFIIDGPVGQLGVSILAPENQLAQAGVVFVHGSGDASRDASRFAAIMLAENGIASAIFDKRGVGESEGDWHLADFNDLAADVLAVTKALEEQTGLGGNQIGFIGTSQGGWIAPLVASRRSITPFVISIAGPATTPAEEGHWNVVRDLRNAGYDSEAILEADAVMSAWDEGVRQNGDFQLFRNSLEMTRNKEWFEDSGLEQRFTTDFPEWFISWYQGVMDFNPIPVLRQLDMPFLSIMGDQDEEQPWDRSAMLYRELAAEGQDFTVRIYENVGHSMRYLNLDGSSQRWPSRPIDFYSLQLEFVQQSTN
jgi:pimeloyl-ACP methyl ester carboxylesterase